MHLQQKKKYTILFDSMRSKAPESLFNLFKLYANASNTIKNKAPVHALSSEFTKFLETHFLTPPVAVSVNPVKCANYWKTYSWTCDIN